MPASLPFDPAPPPVAAPGRTRRGFHRAAPYPLRPLLDSLCLITAAGFAGGVGVLLTLASRTQQPVLFFAAALTTPGIGICLISYYLSRRGWAGAGFGLLEATILGAIGLDYYLFGTAVPTPFALLVPLSVALLFVPSRTAVLCLGATAGLAGLLYLGPAQTGVRVGAVALDPPATAWISLALWTIVVPVSLAVWLIPTHRLLHQLRRQNRRLRRENRRVRAAEIATRESAALLQAVMDSTPDAITVTDQEGRYRFVNAASARLLGGASPSPPPGAPRLDPVLASRITTAHIEVTGHPAQQEITLPTEPPSTWAVTQVPWRNAAGQLQGVISIAHDITARQAYEQHLAYLASHDALTGLPNRQALEIALILPPESAPAALLFIDLDHFHLVNDTLGHPLGDHVLVALAARLAEACAPEAVLARLGGDEFGALVPHTPLEGALVVAERVRAVVAARPFEVEGHTLELSVSIGVVAVVPGTAPGSAVVAAGEIAMYRAKRLGGNQVQAAQRPDDNAPALTTVTTWIGRLKRALAEDRFHLYFQPVVRVATGVVSHYEVLVRLPDGTGRLFSPDSFIPVAERHGLMGALDRWVADRVLTTLREQPTLAVFMNLSARSLSDVGLRDHLLAELISHPGLANRLGFEITETAVVEDVGRAVAWMAPLQACGCRFALDDFGAGFTSIAYVAQLPVTHLKLDRALIAPLGQDAASQGIVQALHLLGQALGKEMVAEGVETVGQWAVVQRLGFTYAQGYYLGRPAAQPDPLLEPRRASQGGSADGPGTPGVRAR